MLDLSVVTTHHAQLTQRRFYIHLLGNVSSMGPLAPDHPLRGMSHGPVDVEGDTDQCQEPRLPTTFYAQHAPFFWAHRMPVKH